MASIDELWLTDFGEPYPGEPAAFRPALILGPPSPFGATFPFVLVAPLTSRHRGLSLHISVEADDRTGLDVDSVVQCELVRSINRTRLIHRIGVVDPATSRAVSTVIRSLFDH